MNIVNVNSPSVFIIDGHWFTRSRYAIVLLENPHCTFMQDIERDKKALWQKLTMDLFAEVRNLGSLVNRVWITSDYISWRKDVQFISPPWETEDFNESYKSQRVNSEEVNWQAVHQAFSEWAEMMQRHFGIPYFKVHGAEADDLMYYLSEVANKLGFNALLFSKDGDTKQNIRTNENGSFTAVYTKVKKGKGLGNENHLIGTKELIDAINNPPQVNVFDFDFNTKGSITEKYNEFFHEYKNDVNPSAFLLEKAILGDKKDNIYPVMYRRMKNIQKPRIAWLNEAVEGLGKSMERLKPEDLYNEQFIDSVLEYLHGKTMKMSDLPANYKEHYTKKFNENRTLLTLSTKEIPLAIIDAMKARVIENYELIKGTSKLMQAGNFHEVLNVFGMQTGQNYTLPMESKGGNNDPFATLDILG